MNKKQFEQLLRVEARKVLENFESVPFAEEIANSMAEYYTSLEFNDPGNDSDSDNGGTLSFIEMVLAIGIVIGKKLARDEISKRN